MRLFLAVGLDERAHLRLHHQLAEAFPGGLPGRPVPPHNWHLTLRFYGKVDAVGLDRLAAGLDQAPLGGPFRLRLSELGAFPRPRRAQVIWLGVDEGVGRLTELAEVAEEEAQAAGLAPEERPFRPHLTLSRMRPAVDVADVMDHPVAVSTRVDQLTLYESLRSSTGLRYEPRVVFRLG